VYYPTVDYPIVLNHFAGNHTSLFSWFFRITIAGPALVFSAFKVGFLATVLAVHTLIQVPVLEYRPISSSPLAETIYPVRDISDQASISLLLRCDDYDPIFSGWQ
jgi:hypothetical protein